MIVVGIDPGSLRTGWGAVRQVGSRLELVGAGVFRPRRADPLERRLAQIQVCFTEVLGRIGAQQVALEAVFHGVNTRSMMVLGQARGALLAAAGQAGLACLELSPASVKKAVTGRGAATKAQVAHMVGALLGLHAGSPGLGDLPMDATDALAVAIAALHRTAPPSVGDPELAALLSSYGRRAPRRKKSFSRGLSGKGGGGFYARIPRNLG